jgi:Phosphatase
MSAADSPIEAARPKSMPLLPAPPSRDELRAHLVAHLIAGDVATSRENNLGNYRRLAERDPRHLFGIKPRGRWAAGDILALMAERCGVSPDPDYRYGPDRIDPDRTIDALEAVAARLRKAAEREERVLLATGHPGGLLPVYLEFARALAARGSVVLSLRSGRVVDGTTTCEVRHIGGVAMLSAGGGLRHTHSPAPMQAMLAGLNQAGQPLPDIVVADHGWAGAAGQAGVDTVGFADSNDPALFVAEAEGIVGVTVPLDDNVDPRLYAPLTAYVLQSADLCY